MPKRFCKNAGFDILDHFPEVRKKVKLPPEEDIKKLERKVKSNEKKLAQDSKK